MIDKAAILASALEALIPSPVRADRAPYVRSVAPAIVEASEEATCSGPWAEVAECRRVWPGPPEELEAFVGVLGFWESGYLSRIQTGDCRKWGPRKTDVECDGRIVVEGRSVWKSVSFFQIQNLSLDQRREVTGLEPMHLYEASRQAARVVSDHRGRCHVADWAGCVFTGLAGTMVFRQAPARAATFRRVYANLIRETRDEDLRSRSVRTPRRSL